MLLKTGTFILNKEPTYWSWRIDINTRFSYLYRDACNYKKHHDIVFAGVLEETSVRRFLRDTEFFIPYEIGLPELQDSEFTSDDHIWHEFVAVESTMDIPTDSRDAEEFLAFMERASALEWNEFEAMKRWGIL